VGAYDDEVMPALMLFSGRDCDDRSDVSFLMFNREKGSYGGQFSYEEIVEFRTERTSMVKSIMMRSGYDVTLYGEDFWDGLSETHEGSYESVHDGRLKCQNLEIDELID